jgi:hypothetical protein
MWRVLALLSDEARSLTGGGLERVVAQYWGVRMQETCALLIDAGAEHS